MFSHTKKTLAYFTALLLIIGLAAILSLPRLAPAVRADAEADPLEGTWRVTVKGEDGTSFRALFTFARGGVMMESDETQLTRPIGTNGQGVWKNTGPQYAFVWENFLFDPYQNFAPVGKLRLRGTITLTGTDTFAGTDQFEYLDLNGNVIYAGSSSEEATRMTIELASPPPAATPPISNESGSAESLGGMSSEIMRGWKPTSISPKGQ